MGTTPTDRHTDRQTDRQTDIWTQEWRAHSVSAVQGAPLVACMAMKPPYSAFNFVPTEPKYIAIRYHAADLMSRMQVN